MLVIRLRRAGAKKRPLYRVVVADSRSARDGRFVEILGSYDPTSEPEQIRIDAPRLKHWLDVGARPSPTIRTMVARHNLLAGQGQDAAAGPGEPAAS